MDFYKFHNFLIRYTTYNRYIFISYIQQDPLSDITLSLASMPKIKAPHLTPPRKRGGEQLYWQKSAGVGNWP